MRPVEQRKEERDGEHTGLGTDLVCRPPDESREYGDRRCHFPEKSP